MREISLQIWHNSKCTKELDLNGDDTLTISLVGSDQDTDLCGVNADGTVVVWDKVGIAIYEHRFDLPKDCEYPNCHDYADDVVQGKDLCASHASEFRQLFGNNS